MGGIKESRYGDMVVKEGIQKDVVSKPNGLNTTVT
jgi:hypothetical protein